jgi:hypothetical protein
VSGCCEHGHVLSDFVNGKEFLEQLSVLMLLKKNSAPWS